MRIGQSTDIHQLAINRKLILGGVEIDHPFGLVGHSDADVLLHVIAESIIGALALGDIGQHFPDTDPKYKGISSIKLLEHVYNLMKSNGYQIGNIDSLVIIEKPILSPYILEMKYNIAKALKCSPDIINVKATRGEKLGYIGREEGVMAQAVVLLKRSIK
ncbi:MAG: 2-C-methyl-D-erythritol 2,4-cyclodiphosphate synthase [Erysipelothrix sp.]|nr:2-C-methyl-D-erythritol 2,4-cyclodiphosphate synthase [Erysipelothrix sp.]